MSILLFARSYCRRLDDCAWRRSPCQAIGKCLRFGIFAERSRRLPFTSFYQDVQAQSMRGQPEIFLSNDFHADELTAVAHFVADKAATVALQQERAQPLAGGENGFGAKHDARRPKHAPDRLEAVLNNVVAHVMKSADEYDHVETVIRKLKLAGIHAFESAAGTHLACSFNVAGLDVDARVAVFCHRHDFGRTHARRATNVQNIFARDIEAFVEMPAHR